MKTKSPRAHAPTRTTISSDSGCTTKHLLVDGQKMAKSAGNFFMLRDFSDRERLAELIKKGAPEALLKLNDRGLLARCLRYV